MDRVRPLLTYRHLTQLPDDGKRYEILEGDLVVSPSPNRTHQRCVWRLIAFFQQGENRGYGQGYAAPFDVVFDDFTVTEPDVFFIRTDRLSIVTESHVQGPPDLIVEVLSPSTRIRDQEIKAHLYAHFGVGTYWVVDPDIKTLTIYQLAPGGYEMLASFNGEQVVHSALFPDVALTVRDIFRG